MTWIQRISNLYLDAFRGLPREVWALSVVLLINRAGTMVLTFIPLYLTQELGFELAFAGQVLSVYGLGHLLGAILGGWSSDRVGALRVQALSLAASGVMLFGLGQARTAAGILLLTLLTATVTEAFRPANGAALAAFAPPGLRTRAMALNRMALNLGFSVGPAVGGWLAVRDYAWLFRVDSATCLLASCLLLALFRGHDFSTLPASPPGMESRTTEGVDPSTDIDPSTDMDFHPFQDRVLLAFLGLTVLFTVIFFQGWSTYPVYMHDVYGFDEAQFGLLLTFNALLILAFEMVLTHRTERFPPLRIVGIGAFLFGLGMAILPLGHGVTLAVISVVLWTVGEMLLAPAGGGFVANRADDRHRGKTMGLYTMAWGVGFIIGPAGGTWLYQHAGPEVLWAATGVIGAIVWFFAEVLQRKSIRNVVVSINSSIVSKAASSSSL